VRPKDITQLEVRPIRIRTEELCERGVKIASGPTNQVYEIREMTVDDPDGYELVFFAPVSLPACQSCGVPLTDARPGQKSCPYCTNEKGQLRSFEQVFEGTVTGYFMAIHKLPRKEAEKAAREHLQKMPAWSSS
jgi:Putative zinc ribbon domain